MLSKKNLLLLWIIILCNILQAQQYTSSLDFWTVEDGLSDRRVLTVFKAHDGLLWLSTRNGLNSFDGYHFRHWLNKVNGFDLKNISRIGQDDEGWLWLINKRELVFFHPNTETFQTVTERFGEDCMLNTFKLNDNPDNLRTDEKNRIYFERVNSTELYSYHSSEGFKKYTLPVTFDFHMNIHPIDAQNMYLKDGRKGFIKISRSASNATFKVDDYYFITAEGLLEKTNQKTYQSKDFAYNDENFAAVHVDFKNDRHWVTGLDGIIRVYDKSGLLLHQKKFENISEGQQKRLGNIEIDNQNRIWICRHFGFYLFEIHKNAFQFAATPSQRKFGTSSVRGMMMQKGKLLAQFEPPALGQLDLNTNHWSHQKLEGANKTFYINHENDYWIGGSFKLLHYTNGEYVSYEFPNSGTIWSIQAFDQDDNTLLIGADIGLFTFDIKRGKFERYSKTSPYINDTLFLVLDIFTDKKSPNKHWLCTDKGLILFDEKNGIEALYSNEEKGAFYLPAENFQYVYQDENEVYWLATAGDGIIRWNRKNNTYQQFSQKDGLANNVIYAIFEDGYQTLWMSSDFGIIKMHKETFNVENFTPSSGIGQKEFNRISHLQTQDGQIFFGGLNGVTYFHPKDFQVNTRHNTPLLVLSQFKQFNGKGRKAEDKTIEARNKKIIRLRPRDYILDLQFSVLSYSQVGNNQYSYQLTKNGKPYASWQTQKKRSVQLGQLPYGRYQLTVKGKNAYGTETANSITLDIIVLRPFYLQWWFLLLMITALTSGVYYFIRWRTSIYKIKQSHLESEIEKATHRIRIDKQTIQAQANKLKRLDEMKTTFFANVSHELRTPLTLMLGPIRSVLKRNTVDNRSYTFLSTAEQNGKRLLQLVNEILDLNKLEAGKLELNNQTVAFYPFIKRVISSFTSYAENLGVAFHFKYNLEKEIHVSLDKKKLETIIHNLLSNAFKYTPKGGKVSIEIFDTLKASDTIQISVSDTGRGIHPEDMPNIFNRFYQASQKGKAEGGTGIGLALSKELAQLLGGDLTVESELFKGSTFDLTITKNEVLKTLSDNDYLNIIEENSTDATHEITPLVANHSAVSNNKEKPTILIVEDNPSLQNYLQLILQDDYHIILANNGKEGLEQLAVGSEQLAVSSWQWAVGSGQWVVGSWQLVVGAHCPLPTAN